MDYKSMQPGAEKSTNPHHFFLGGFTALVLLVVYISINTPSASTANLSESNTPSGSDINLSPGTGQAQIPMQVPMVDSNSLEPGLVAISQDARTQGSEKIGDAEIVLASYSPPQETEQDTGTAYVAVQGGHKPDLSHSGPEQNFTRPEVEPESPDPIELFLETQDWITSKVKRGDTLSQMFRRNDLEIREAFAIAKLEDAGALLKIRPGEEIRIKKGPQGQLGLLQYQLNPFEILSVRMAGEPGKYTVSRDVREPEIRINNARATVNYSLLGAAQEAGVSYKTMYQFIAMFGWQVDFTMDLQSGDRFSIIFEELFLDDKKFGAGEIIAAELVVSGKKLQAVRYVDDDGFTDYFAPDGDGIKGTFLRSPLKFGHITSNFSKSRLHPISKTWRAHNGADYGAPRGTPVMATGNGTVTAAGRRNGYGKAVLIRHGGKYETLYAHLSGYAKGIKSGARVSQGDIIGYVGSTGLATGPHLHYEFRIHGIHKNPVTVVFPKSEPIAVRYLPMFTRSASIWVSELDHLDRISLAQNQAAQ
jgi:murein DD-endopeptidase MepM/ murein hydrolase activator NlpD